MPSGGKKLSVEAAVEPVLLSASLRYVATTSSALKSAPSWNLTPWRSLNVQVLASGDGVHEIANSGWGTPAPSTRTRKLRQGKTVMMPPLEVNLCGLISTVGEPVTRIMPPRRGWALAAEPAAAAGVAGGADPPAGGAPGAVGVQASSTSLL